MPIQCPYCGSEHPDHATACPSTGRELTHAHRLIGKTLGKYEILRLIGEGGMGAVFEARHVEVRRRVALKLLNPYFAQDPQVLARFKREARATGEIGHENIIEIYDIAKDPASGATYLVLELLKGRTLLDLIQEKGGLSVKESVDIMLQVLSALHASHALGIIHRDLKPENIFLITRAGRKNWVKLLDFGIAKIKETDEGQKLTQTGAMMGTPYYMAPEQIRGQREIDQRLDVYACGVILYQCITGKVPFDFPTVPALVYAILNETPVDPAQSRPGTPDELSMIILKAMARDPEMRFQSSQEMAQALEKFGSGFMEVEEELRKGDELARTLLGRMDRSDSTMDTKSATDLEWGKSDSKTPGLGRRMALIAGIGLAAILLVAGGAYLLSSWSKDYGTATDKVESAVTSAAHPKKPVENLEEKPEAVDASNRIQCLIDTVPKEAVIYLDGAPVNQNPLSATFEKSDTPRLLEVSHEGYESFKEWITFNVPVKRTIELTAAAATVEAAQPPKKKKSGSKQAGDKASNPDKTEKGKKGILPDPY